MSSQKEQLDAMKSWLDNALETGAVPVVTGQNGDMDTVGSAIALSSYHSGMLSCGLHLGRVAKKMVAKYDAPFRKITEKGTAWPQKMGGIVIVDAGSPDQVGFDIPDVPLLVIDHHATNGWELKDNDLMLQWDVRATTEIITQFLSNHAPSCLSTNVRRMLLAGLITDTGRFKHADQSSFVTASLLLEDTAIDYAEFSEHLEKEQTNPSERGSLLRGMSRSKMHAAGDWSLVTTYAGTLEGRLASMLLGVGSDVTLVSRFKDGSTRLTARASRNATLRGVHLGNIMQEVARQHGGEGGGHDGAAGWTGEIDRIRAESAFIAHLTLQKELKQ